MSLPYLQKATGPVYLTQCACFACRKSFKKDVSDPRYTPSCPECGKPLVQMGRYFRAPRKSDIAQWKKVEMLRHAGVYFGGSQSWELGKFPETIREAKAFIAKNAALLESRAKAGARSKSSAIAALEKTDARQRELRAKKRPNQSLQHNASTMSSSTIKSAVRHG